MTTLFLTIFFFQAEDGIRDGHVTGVQTCALPILLTRRSARTTVLITRRAAGRFGRISRTSLWRQRVRWSRLEVAQVALRHRSQGQRRSEERRVGKEGRRRME